MEMDETQTGAVFVQTNAPRNAVVAYERRADGRLVQRAKVETGGSGSGAPHLPSQGSVVLSGDGRFLLVTNAASDDVTLFSVRGAELTVIGRVAVGATPWSIAERDGSVYVLATGKPGIVGFRLSEDGLAPLAGGEVALSDAGADPAQVGFAPDGSALIVTERGTDAIEVVPVGPDGVRGLSTTVSSQGPTPYGFAFTSDGRLVVTEAFRAESGAAAASSYVWRDGTLAPVTGSVGNGRSEICWAVIADDRFAFTTNFADGAVSRYSIGTDGSLTLEDAVAGVAIDGDTGLRDEDLSAEGRFLYAIDADGGRIYGWAVGTDGSLTAVGSWDGIPATVAGLAAI